ncbi:hypothetical protein ACU4GD_24740 [Cupriavidus basilensis]
MQKNNAGYDVRQLFVGSEGTLGVITRAVLRLATAAGGHANGAVRARKLRRRGAPAAPCAAQGSRAGYPPSKRCGRTSTTS